MGCYAGNCDNAPKWIYSTSYWMGSVFYYVPAVVVGAVGSNAACGTAGYNDYNDAGLRPVIKLSLSYF